MTKNNKEMIHLVPNAKGRLTPVRDIKEFMAIQSDVKEVVMETMEVEFPGFGRTIRRGFASMRSAEKDFVLENGAPASHDEEMYARYLNISTRAHIEGMLEELKLQKQIKRIKKLTGSKWIRRPGV